VHTTYLWHMHQSIYWPNVSAWTPDSYEFAYETITNGTSQSDVFSIFNSDDRVADYQGYPRDALSSVLGTPDAGAQISFAGSLIQNVNSLAAAGWNGGRYASNWTQPYRDAHAWTTSGGRTRLDPVIVAFHHSINPLCDEEVFRRMIQTQKAILPATWGDTNLSTGFFPAEMCFSERLIPILVSEGVDWSIVADIHIARACADYPAQADLDNCDPPNPADRLNPAQGSYDSQTISRGVTTRVPAPYGFRPHYAEYVDPTTGVATRMVVVPAANAMSWNEGFGLYGTGDIDRIAAANDPDHPMLVLFAHDGDNAWSGGFSYYHENVSQFVAAAVARGYEPSTVAEYLADHPVDPADVVHVEDGGWVNADGDFGSPQFINWNWPLVDATGQFDIPGGWAEDERNWAVLTAAVNRVLTAEQIAGAPDPARIADPSLPGATAVEKAWRFLLVGHESGYMYYGTSLDMEVKPTLAANAAVSFADPVIAGGTDATAPTIWLPQRLPWNPGGNGGGALWGYPGGAGAAMSQDFFVWTFVYDVSGVDSVRFCYRIDADGTNSTASTDNETYAGGAEVGAWQSADMTRRVFPKGNVTNNPEINFTVLPTYIADEYWIQVSGLIDQLVDYYVEAVDPGGNRRRSPIQHVYVGSGGSTGGGNAVSWVPTEPAAGGSVTICYDPAGGSLPPATSPVYIHIGHSGWNDVLSPDPALTYDTGAGRWTYTYAVPSGATTVDFVFTDGLGAWDNNGGADWHVPVSGAAPPPFTMDGVLDGGVAAVATCNGADLYASYDGTWLYVAAPTAAAAGLDRFLHVSTPATTGTVNAPWAKSGTCARYDRLLGNEESNNWTGWFDGNEAATTTGVTAASGAVLEGLIDVAAVFGTAPAEVRVAFAAYWSADGGTLSVQTPCGNGDGNLDPGEWVTLSAATTAVPQERGLPGLRILSGNPFRHRVRAEVAGRGERTRVDVLDVTGRRVASLFDGIARERVTVSWNPGNEIPAGVFFLRVREGAHQETRRLVRLP